MNDAACRGFGYSRQQLLSMTVNDIDLESSPKDWPAHWKELTEKSSLTFESQHKAADGRIFPVEVTANYIEFGGQEYNFTFAGHQPAQRAQTSATPVSEDGGRRHARRRNRA